MPPKKYKTVSLPKKLLKRVEELINKEDWGYRSPTEFVREAIRDKLQYYVELKKKEKDK